MGHVEPGGAAGGPAADADRLWSVWQRLTKAFTLRPLLAGALLSRTAWGVYSVDLISGLRRSSIGRQALKTVADVTDQDLDRLADLARVNAQRHDSMWRMLVMFYVSVPATLLLALLQVFPDAVLAAIREGSFLLWTPVGVLLVSMLYYFGAQWRARQVVALLEIARLERAQAPSSSQARGAK